MNKLNDIKQEIAKAVIKIGAVGFRPNNPLTFKSGLISPVYIDNRKFPFNPREWQTVIDGFVKMAEIKKIDFDVIAGIEAAGIPHSATLGYTLKKPSVFTRKQVKGHGTKKMVEGGVVSGKTVLLIEDHVTTGHSSLLGVKAVRTEGGIVKDCFAITSYDFKKSRLAFEKDKVSLHVLTNFKTILTEAHQQKILNTKELTIIEDWFKDPGSWAKKHGFEGKGGK